MKRNIQPITKKQRKASRLASALHKESSSAARNKPSRMGLRDKQARNKMNAKRK